MPAAPLAAKPKIGIPGQTGVPTQTGVPGANSGSRQLNVIPVLDVGPSYPLETLNIEIARARALLDLAAGHTPQTAIRMADAVSRRWLQKSQSPYLAEIDAIAVRLAQPGAHFFNVHYEWGCTTAAVPAPDGQTARLIRVLDWKTAGLGRFLIAARISGANGNWVSLTWPGFAGCLQAMAPGRFAAALNQAPMASSTPFMPADWANNRIKVWRRPHLPPAHLLRRIFEEAPDFATAKQMMLETPLCVPTIFTLAGLGPDEACVIERQEESASLREDPAIAANDWQTEGWTGRPRGLVNAERCNTMKSAMASFDPEMPWLVPPVLNSSTRLALVADASLGQIIVRGFEDDGPATEVLRLAA